MIVKGRVHRFGDDIDTDAIISSRNKAKFLEIADLARHAFEDIDPGFPGRFSPGDIIVAGRNFGCGSSREAAPRVLQALGAGAVVAESFARIFFRNAINIGLPALPCDTRRFADGDTLEIDLSAGRATDLTNGATADAEPLPPVMLNIVADGGLAAHLRRHGRYVLERQDG